MKQARCDHALHNSGDKIYAFGGMSVSSGDGLQSLNTCEVYDINEDKWSAMLAFSFARQ